MLYERTVALPAIVALALVVGAAASTIHSVRLSRWVVELSACQFERDAAELRARACGLSDTVLSSVEAVVSRCERAVVQTELAAAALAESYTLAVSTKCRGKSR